MVLMHRTAY